jgi:Protein of unknown function (DUF3489)
VTDTIEATTIAATPATKRKRKMARKAKTEGTERPAPDNISAKRQSKVDLVLGLLKRPEGATIDQLVAATGWLPHTTRAALTGLKKKGHMVSSEKLEGQGRVYRVTVA